MAQERVTVTLNALQEVVNYPAGTTAGSVMGCAIYAENQYIPLKSRIITVQGDTDQEMIAGGAILDGVTGRPRFYEQKAQIRIWPRTDQSYPLRIEYMQRMDLPDDSSVSLVDAQLIVYQAASMIARQQENNEGAAYYAEMYQDRLGALKGWQSAFTTFALSTDADLGEDEANYVETPNWDRRPTTP